MKKFSLKSLAMLTACLMLVTVVLVAPVSAEDTIEAADSIYVSAINLSVTGGSGTIFTKDFNGTNTITTAEANFKWVTFFTAKPTTTANVYEVVAIDVNSDGQPNAEIAVPDGGFIYAGHCDDSDKTSDIYKKSAANLKAIGELTVGAQVTVSGVDFTNKTVTATANIVAGESDVSVVDTSSESVSEVLSDTESTALSENDSSAPATNESSEEDTSEPTSTATSEVTSDSEDPENNTMLYVGIGAAAVVLIAVIAFAATRKKK